MKKHASFFILIFLFTFSTVFGQLRSLKKAKRLFKEELYAEAAVLFEKSLAEKDQLSIKSKLAYCYLKNNQIEKAETLYNEIVVSGKAKPKMFYYYGEALMRKGKYDEAKKWFEKYREYKPEKKDVELLIHSCEYAKSIQPYFENIEIREFPNNSDADDNTAIFWNDGIVFSSDRNPGIQFLKEKAGWTGRDYLNLFYSKFQTDSTFSEPRLFSGKLNEVNINTANPSITADSSEIFFTRNINEPNKKGIFPLQIFSAKATKSGNWKKPKVLSFCSMEFNYMHPAISPNGNWLFFVSDRNGEGGTDIYLTKRTKKGWSKPQNLGKSINTSANEGFPFYHQDGKLYFTSKGHPGLGGFDIFVTELDENGKWKTPVNLGYPVNSSNDDISFFLSKDKNSGLFSSSRNGNDDIFIFSKKDYKFLQNFELTKSQ